MMMLTFLEAECDSAVMWKCARVGSCEGAEVEGGTVGTKVG